ncbi:MAG: hypothetical protein FJX75_18005 [Armatimonadetes bacterium]|nr:hypothetical protein [Armatimonadota bacterium]
MAIPASMMLAAIAATLGAQTNPMTPIVFESQYAKLLIGADAKGVCLIDKDTGQDYAQHTPEAAFATATVGGKEHAATSAVGSDDRVTFAFGDLGPRAVIGVRPRERYFYLKVLEASEDVEALTFCHVPLTVKGTLEEPFAACMLALDLQTNVTEAPGPNRLLRAMCVKRFGLVGAEAALVACPTGEMRNVLKEAVAAAPDLPHSPVGGPWAMDGPLNRTSYLFNFGGLNEQTADEWIARAKAVGFNQIQIHGGGPFRFGDCALDPNTYPNGLASVKAMTNKLHAAGLCVGMQPYAFFIDKRCPWVTPKPDPRLASDATFTLAGDLSADATEVPVVETTESMSTITGFFVRNSITLRIGEELVTYSGVTKQPPYAFTGCQRGAYGTTPSAHAAGAKVDHLKECFGLFVPDPETTLLAEVAGKIAELYNEGGFDCIYLDALDGEDVLGGWQNSWHYGAQFVFEIWKRLERPAVMEYSTFHHHLWYLRSRMGAWDHPTRSHKAFVDMHVRGNEANDRMFLPSNLGWWAFLSWQGIQTEPTFPDDIEYLCCKAIATGSGLSMTTFDPNSPAHQRLAEVTRRYEAVRNANVVPASVKAILREPGRDFALVEGTDAHPQFRPMRYAKHKAESPETNAWKVTNEFASQPLAVRIEALAGCSPYGSEGSLAVADLAEPAAFGDRAAAPGVTLDVQPSTEQVKVGERSARLTATSTLATRRGSWAKIGRAFEPNLDLSKNQALGVWVHGDGQGEVLNFQRRSPHYLSGGIEDHYVTVDFTGWRYVELVEPEGERHAEYGWPYGGEYAMYRELVSLGRIETLSVWVNSLPPNGTVTCYLSPVQGVSVFPIKLSNPAVTVGGKTITFPCEMETGSYLEFRSMGDCKVYGPNGALLAEVQPTGDVPTVGAGENEVAFACGGPEGIRARARVTVITKGEAVDGT